MKEIFEAFRKVGDPEDCFDIEFWQAQGPKAIFEAAMQMIIDAETLRTGHAVEPRLPRTVEYFGKI